MIRLQSFKVKKSKYKNCPIMIDGFRFQSKAEAKRYSELKILRRAGEIKYFLRQVPFHIEGGIKYLADFLIIWNNGEITIEDVKGFETQAFKTKKKLVEYQYNIIIEKVKKV